MNLLWGILMALIGLFLLVSALYRSDFIIYKLFVAKSKLFWGDNVHTFFVLIGVLLLGLSSLFFFGIWG